MNVSKAIAVSSGTAALLCALAGAEIAGDEVIVPAYTWVASACTVATMGGIPILAEVDETLTLDPRDVVRKITSRTKAILPVHMRGVSANMDELLAIAKRNGLKVIEDVAQAIGGSYRGRPLGGIGNAGCFSLQYHKIITCGEGGLLITSDDQVYKRALMFHDPIAGKTSDFPAEEILLGMNFRMPELTGAVALVQLSRLDGLIRAMRAHKHVIKEGISKSLARCGGFFRTLPDPYGDTAIALIFFMPSGEMAQYVTQALRAENISASSMFPTDQVDYHIYINWAPILEKRTWTPHGLAVAVGHTSRI